VAGGGFTDAGAGAARDAVTMPRRRADSSAGVRSRLAAPLPERSRRLILAIAAGGAAVGSLALKD
jgi:hypothetical protein